MGVRPGAAGLAAIGLTLSGSTLPPVPDTYPLNESSIGSVPASTEREASYTLSQVAAPFSRSVPELFGEKVIGRSGEGDSGWRAFSNGRLLATPGGGESSSWPTAVSPSGVIGGFIGPSAYEGAVASALTPTPLQCAAQGLPGIRPVVWLTPDDPLVLAEHEGYVSAVGDGVAVGHRRLPAAEGNRPASEAVRWRWDGSGEVTEEAIAPAGAQFSTAIGMIGERILIAGLDETGHRFISVTEPDADQSLDLIPHGIPWNANRMSISGSFITYTEPGSEDVVVNGVRQENVVATLGYIVDLARLPSLNEGEQFERFKLPPAGGMVSVIPFGVNAEGVVVGISFNPGGPVPAEQTATVWLPRDNAAGERSYEAYDLNALCGDREYRLVRAMAVSGRGEIAVVAERADPEAPSPVTVLLTPN